MRALIVEDEQLAIKRLEKLCSLHEEDIQLVGIATDGEQAVSMINELRPHLVFLDINIPVINGLEVLRKISVKTRVIFCTAYDEHALQAFDLGAIDYLLKPIEEERFAQAIMKIKELRQWPELPGSMLDVLDNYFAKKEFTTISVRLGEKIKIIPLIDVAYFVAEDKYVVLNTIDSDRYLLSHTVQYLQEILPSHFIRISRSVIVNSNHILEARKLFGKRYIIKLRDKKQSEVETGGRHVLNFLKIISI